MPGALYGPLDEPCFDALWKGEFIQSVLISDVGKRRQNNEDSCMLCVPEDDGLKDARGMLFAVADGMGGASAGEYASRKTLECVCSKYYDKSEHGLVPPMLRAAVDAANAFVFKESERKPEYAGMGTTLSAMVVLGNWAYIAQVGDSRIYLLRESEGLKQITYDHSLVAEQIRSGLINESDARNHSLKNLITRAVGIKEDVDADLFALKLHEDDTLLLCSDGLSNMVGDELLGECLLQDDLEKATRQLVQHALSAGGTDNITVVTVRLIAPPPESNYQAGARLFSFEKPGFFARLLQFLRLRQKTAS